MDKRSNKRQNLTALGLGVVVVLLLNVVSQYVFFRLDLTSEKRYTLAESTVQMLDSLDDVVYFEVYLEGEFPQGAGDYKRLRDETRLMLDEFRAWGGDNIQYDFVDPGANDDERERKKFQRQLAEKGLIPHPETFVDDNGVEVTQLLFPWAVARYHGKEVAIPLLGSSTKSPNEEVLNHAVEGLEYELSNGVRKLLMRRKPKVAITQGHGEPDSIQVNDFLSGLREYYDVEFVQFGNKLNTFRDTVQNASQIRNIYDAVIMIAPDSAFTTKELFILDQYIMYGGKALFLVDPVLTSIDSLSITGRTMAMPRHFGLKNEPGLEDILYSYGAGLKSQLVEDLYCAQVAIPVNGPQKQFVPAPWVYSPTILPQEKHPIVKNLDRIKFDFVSTIDTISTSAPIRKEVLIRSSDKSTIMRTPNEVVLMYAMMDRDPRTFNKPHQNVAVLLEGTFHSYFRQKILPPEIENSPEIGYLKNGRTGSRIIVIADGDVAINPVYQGQALPLGLDRLNRMNRNFYANKKLLINCANYLLDDNGLLSVRSREVTLRLLDRGKIKEQRLKWQLINTILPIASIMLFGLFRMWARRKKYGSGMLNSSRKGPFEIMEYVMALISGVILYLMFSNWILAGAAVAIVLGLFFIRSKRQSE
ncbi:MAG: hypothetical protein RL007_1342 [Bacteroidota bacterium]